MQSRRCRLFCVAATLFAFALTPTLTLAQQERTDRWRRSPERWLQEQKNPDRARPTVPWYFEQDKKNPPPKEAVLFAGSATIWLWDLEKWFPEYTTINRGFGGSQISDSLFFVDRLIIPHRPSTIVMYAGDNDVWAGKPAFITALHFEEFIWKIHEALPDAQIVYISIRPSIAAGT